MDCNDTRHLIDAAIDGELDLPTQLALEAHMAGCAACREAHAQRRALVRRVRAGADRFTTPDDLAFRLLAALPEATPMESRAPTVVRRRWWGWVTGGLSLASAALAVVLTLIIAQPGRDEALERDLVASHVRSLMADHLTDVASSDRHTVKPWFNGRVDLSPPVPDLAEQGFPLVGGRLDYVAGRPVAVLVYRRARHVINLFVWPGPMWAPDTPRHRDEHGFNVLHWTSPDLDAWAVSDLNRGELEDFQRLWSQASRSTP
ncbi:anti-sigma factor family protein [Azospirillum sp. sgz302134]